MAENALGIVEYPFRVIGGEEFGREAAEMTREAMLQYYGLTLSRNLGFQVGTPKGSIPAQESQDAAAEQIEPPQKSGLPSYLYLGALAAGMLLAAVLVFRR